MPICFVILTLQLTYKHTLIIFIILIAEYELNPPPNIYADLFPDAKIKRIFAWTANEQDLNASDFYTFQRSKICLLTVFCTRAGNRQRQCLQPFTPPIFYTYQRQIYSFSNCTFWIIANRARFLTDLDQLTKFQLFIHQ